MKLKLFALFFSVMIFVRHSHAQIPTLVWADAMSGTLLEAGQMAVADGSGNVYTVGTFDGSTDFDPGAGTSMLTTFGTTDVFITKFTASGSFVWARSFGGVGVEGVKDMTLDASGNVYLCGSFSNSVDFDPESGSFVLTSEGNTDIYVCKITTTGSLGWARAVGSSGFDNAFAIDLGLMNEVYTAGSFADTIDFNPGVGIDQRIPSGSADGYLLKLDASGLYVSTLQFGGTGGMTPNDVRVNSTGAIYIGGSFTGAIDLDPGAGTLNYTSAGLNDAFVCKLDASGILAWGKKWGTTTNEFVYGIAVDTSDNVITAGRFELTVDFDPGTGTYSLTSAGSWDACMSKLDGSGGFIWAKNIGGSGGEQANSVVTDAGGSTYFTGGFGSGGAIDFDPGPGTFNLISTGGSDGCLWKLDTAGDFVWAIKLGGTGADVTQSSTIDGSGNIYTSGYFSATADFDPGAGTFNITSAGSYDAFTLKLSQSPTTGIASDRDYIKAVVYPNPSEGQFFLKHPTSVSFISIVNVLGETLARFQADPSGTTAVNMDNVVSGTYFYSLESDCKPMITGKLIVK